MCVKTGASLSTPTNDSVECMTYYPGGQALFSGLNSAVRFDVNCDTVTGSFRI